MGKNYKELLISYTNVYNEDNVSVVGQVRTDNLVEDGYLKTSKRSGILKITLDCNRTFVNCETLRVL